VRAGLVQIEAQQPALDGAVEEAMGTPGIDAEIPGKRRIAGQYRGLPALEPVAQDAAELRIQSGQSRFRADTLAVGRIGYDESGLALGRDDLAQRAFLHMQPIGNPGMLAVGNGHTHRVRIGVGAQHAAPRRGKRAPGAGFRAQALP
jgi:hypothetical protein